MDRDCSARPGRDEYAGRAGSRRARLVFRMKRRVAGRARRPLRDRFGAAAAPRPGREPVHPGVAELPASGDVLVHAAEQPTVGGGRDAPTLREGLDVVELDLVRRTADASAVQRPLALALVTFPDRAPDLGGGIADIAIAPSRWRRGRGRGRLRRLRALPRVLHEATPLRSALEQEVETDLQDRVLARARMGMGERRARLLELAEEAPRHRDVEPALVGGLVLDVHSQRLRPERRRGRRAAAGRRSQLTEVTILVGQMNRLTGIRRRREGERDRLRPDRRHHLRRGTDSAGRSSAATAWASRLERWKKRGRTSDRFPAVTTFDSSTTLERHRRPSRSGSRTSGYCWIELGRSHPVERRALGEPELPVEVVEERGVPEPLTTASGGIEVRQRHQEIRHGGVLAVKKLGEMDGLFAAESFMHIASHAFPSPPQAHAFASWGENANTAADVPRGKPRRLSAPTGSRRGAVSAQTRAAQLI